MAQTYHFFSADSHFESAPDRWIHRVPKQYRDRAPRRVKSPHGKDIIVEEGIGITFRGTNQFAGKSLEEFNPVELDFDNAIGSGVAGAAAKRTGTATGIDAELIFATEARNTAIKDKDTFLGILRGFNDYFIEEYCGVAPDRLVGVAVLPNISVQEDIAEMKRCKEKGFTRFGFIRSRAVKTIRPRKTISFGRRRSISTCHSRFTRHSRSGPRARCFSNEVSA